jgi:GTP diphosphokinase / guanosine-3',5'-bis(diphosphate) 3'-diphosphatase
MTDEQRENREKFFARLCFLPRAELVDVHLAYALAKYYFRAKFRKELDDEGHPVRYFEHLRRVALILIDELKIGRPELVIAALLHDAIEDTRPEDLVAETIERHFGNDVIGLVKLLSKVPKEGYLERLLSFGDWRVLVIKGCDRLDNLRTLDAGSAEFQRKQIDETRNKYYPVFDRMVDITPPAHLSQARHLRDEIRRVTDTFLVRPTV